MSTMLRCPNCSRQVYVDDQQPGTQTRCPSCKTVLTLPAAAETAADDSPAAAASQSTSEDDWYLQGSGDTTYGPVSKAELDDWVQQSRVAPDANIRRGDQPWQPATTFYPMLASGSSDASGAGPTENANPFAASPTVGTSSQILLEPHRGTVVLIFGILGWFICCGMGVVAWVMGHQDLQKMRAGVMDPEGKGITQAGYIIGMLSVVIPGVVAVGMIILVVIAAALGG